MGVCHRWSQGGRAPKSTVARQWWPGQLPLAAKVLRKSRYAPLPRRGNAMADGRSRICFRTDDQRLAAPGVACSFSASEAEECQGAHLPKACAADTRAAMASSSSAEAPCGRAAGESTTARRRLSLGLQARTQVRIASGSHCTAARCVATGSDWSRLRRGAAATLGDDGRQSAEGERAFLAAPALDARWSDGFE